MELEISRERLREIAAVGICDAHMGSMSCEVCDGAVAARQCLRLMDYLEVVRPALEKTRAAADLLAAGGKTTDRSVLEVASELRNLIHSLNGSPLGYYGYYRAARIAVSEDSIKRLNGLLPAIDSIILTASASARPGEES